MIPIISTLYSEAVMQIAATILHRTVTQHNMYWPLAAG